MAPELHDGYLVFPLDRIDKYKRETHPFHFGVFSKPAHKHVFIIFSYKKKKWILRIGDRCRKRGEFESIVDVIAYLNKSGIPTIGTARDFVAYVVDGKYKWST
jgi:hypothetical protein